MVSTMSTATASDGTSIAYDVAGAGPGPAIVLVHGITESSETWAPIKERLAENHQIITLDLRGHGDSGMADRYDLEAMAGDVVAVAMAESLEQPHIVGHSLGGAVVSAVGAAMPVTSVVNVDQSLQLGGFKAGLEPVEAMLRDPATFPAVIEGLFAEMSGTMLPPSEMGRITAARQAKQDVVLGVWELMFTMSEEEIAAVVEGALAGYAGSETPYLSLFGIDPGPEYASWLTGFISNATVEVWADHGHYPHLVDPDRFEGRLEDFWSSGG